MSKQVKFNIQLNVDGRNMVVQAKTSVDDLANSLAAAKSKSDNLRGSLISFGQLQMTFQNLQNGLQSVTNFLNNLTEESRSFSAAMKAANTMAGKDAAGFEHLKGQVADLAKNIPIARDQLANGLYQVISNGVPEDNWISYLEASSRSAVGGIANLEEVVKVTSTVIKNYGLEWSAAQDIQDKIQLTAKNGVTSFEQLAAALPSVTGQAAQLGVTFSEMLAVMSTLTGVTGNTSEVATQLGSVLTALTKESSKSQKVADAMGFSFNAASVKAAGGLRNYLQELDKTVTAYAQKTGQLKESIYSQLFGRAEALRMVNALTGNLSDKFAENIQALDNSTGTIDAAFDEMASTGSAKLQILRNALAGIIDHVQGVVGVISPILNFATQIGMTAMAVMSLSKAFAFLKATAVASSIAAGTHNAVSKAGVLVQKILAAQLHQAQRAQLAWAFGAKICAVQATALRVALLAAIPAGIGIAVAALGWAFSALAGSADDAADSMGETSDAAQNLKSMQEQATQEAATMQVELDRQAERLKRLMESHSDTSTAVRELNERYGQIFGTFSTAAQWYDTLISKSQSYCDQLRIEAEARLVAERRAQLSMDRRRNNQKGEKLIESGEWGTNWYGFTNKATQAVIDERKKIEEEDKLLAEREEELRDELLETQSMGGVVITGNKPTGLHHTPVVEDKTKAKNKKTDNAPKLTADPKTEKQLADNVQYYAKQLENANKNDEAAVVALVAKKKAAEEALKAYQDMIEALGVPVDPKTLDDYDKKLQWLRKQRQTASKEAISGIDDEIASLDRERQTLENVSVAALRDDDISTYDELNRKMSYYNDMLEKGGEEQRKAAQNGINQLTRLKEAWDVVLEELSLPSSTNTIADIDKVISFYSSRQQKEDAEQIQKTQQLIDRLEKKKSALSLSMELPSMQKELREIQELTGHDYRVKVDAIGFDGLRDKIKEIEKLMKNPDLTSGQLEQLITLREGYASMLGDAVYTFGTLRSGWEGLKGIGSSVQSITTALQDNKDAWQTATAVIDGFLSVYEGVRSILTIIQMLTAASKAHTTAKTVEAIATTAAGTAEAATAPAAETAAAAQIPVVAANKLATQSFMELASAAYFATHASIPFAGFGIAAGFSAAAKAMVLAIGATPFADGGVIKGPTLGLIGEYAGASHNPEVVAPLDKLRGMIEPAQVMLPPGSIVGKLRGNDIILVAANASRTRALSGHRSNIVT